MRATAAQVAELAAAIALKAEAIAAGTLTGNPHAAARLIADNAATLVAWTAEDTDAPAGGAL